MKRFRGGMEYSGVCGHGKGIYAEPLFFECCPMSTAPPILTTLLLKEIHELVCAGIWCLLPLFPLLFIILI